MTSEDYLRHENSESHTESGFGWDISLRESIHYWTHRLRKIEGRKDPANVRHVRRNLGLLIDTENYGVNSLEFGGIGK